MQAAHPFGTVPVAPPAYPAPATPSTPALAAQAPQVTAPLTVEQAADLLQAGSLVAFPTETVYGLGADACSDAAVARIFAAKGRPADHPLIVHVADAQGIDAFAASVPDFARRLMAAFWPGPLTIIVPRRAGVAAASAGGQGSIGLRCPSHPVAQALLRACAQRGVRGLAAPSANKFGKVSPTTAQHVQGEFAADGAAYGPGGMPVLDGGACSVGIESTIIDCTRAAPVLLRPGVLSVPEIEAAMGCKLLSNEELIVLHSIGQKTNFIGENTPPESLAAPKASGTLAAHYAPNAKLRLMDARALQTALDLLGDSAVPIAVYARAIVISQSSHVLRRRMPDDAAATAQQLFAVLRGFDAQGVKLIWVEAPPADAAWDGVRDRLQRAAAS